MLGLVLLVVILGVGFYLFRTIKEERANAERVSRLREEANNQVNAAIDEAINQIKGSENADDSV